MTIGEATQAEILLFVGLAFVCGLLGVYWGLQTHQFGRVIRDTPPEPVRSVAMGRTEIPGEIVPAARMYERYKTTVPGWGQVNPVSADERSLPDASTPIAGILQYAGAGVVAIGLLVLAGMAGWVST